MLHHDTAPILAKILKNNAKTIGMIPFNEALKTYAKIGLLGFGGPAGQIALMHRIFVEEKNWISEARFLHAVNYCMLLPGPEATQLATYIGWLLHKTKGGIAAGLLFVLPGAALILVLSAIYAQWHEAPLIAALFYGLKSAVLVVVIEALLRIGRRSLRSTAARQVAALAFVGIFFLALPFPLIVLAAGALGFFAPKSFPPPVLKSGTASAGASVLERMEAQGLLLHTQAAQAHSLRTLLDGLAIWFTPVLAAMLYLGRDHILSQLGVIFSRLAVVTFGGAYAVLAYVAQLGLIPPPDMLNGLGLAETTPGPLILVLEYVGYLSAYKTMGHAGGVLGAAMVLWVTFVPCFLWIFLGAPYIESARNNKSLAAALSAINAAVTGVILNLAVWFGLHTLFTTAEPFRTNGVTLYRLGAPDAPAFMIAGVAAIALFRLKMSLPAVLGACAALGLLLAQL
ncbi:MAG TPA: chromate transporter [Patescibacteria group bacterium]|nr:chromate transporter [Patescibacteria group bacterium]